VPCDRNRGERSNNRRVLKTLQNVAVSNPSLLLSSSHQSLQTVHAYITCATT
jgi:hypothetical protein